MPKKKPVAAHKWKDEDAVFAEGCAALEEKLGTDGMLRFLRVVTRGQDRYEDIRRPLLRQTMERIMENMDRESLISR